jgi:hypothetical protein
MTPSWSQCVTSVCAALVAIGACAEPSDDATPSESIIYAGDGPFPPITAAEFPQQLGAARVGLLNKCCDRIGRINSVIDTGPPAPSAASGAVYDEAAGAACIAQYHDLSCPHGKDPPQLSEACQAAYRGGRLQIGETCTTDWECQRDAQQTLICAVRLDETGVVRTCQPSGPALPSAGQSCLPEGTAGLRCLPPAECRDDTCSLPGLGEPCLVEALYGDTCGKGLVCDREGSRLCIEPKRAGSPCASVRECELFACIDGVCAEPLWGLSACSVRPHMQR